jgi:hypothetical protein
MVNLDIRSMVVRVLWCFGKNDIDIFKEKEEAQDLSMV